MARTVQYNVGPMEIAMRILFAVDASTDPQGSIALIAPFAARAKAVVDALYVHVPVDIPPWIDAFAGSSIRDSAEQIRVDRQAALTAAIANLPEANRGTVEAPVGYPGRLIPAALVGRDLLAVATHGRSGLSRLWNGSVAEAVLPVTDTDVLILHTQVAPVAIPAPGKHMRALLAIDPVHTDPSAVDRAAAWAERVDAVIDIVSVHESTSAPALARLNALFMALPPNRRGQAIVAIGEPAEEILARVDIYPLVILTGRTGKVAEHVFRSSPTPVLVTRR